jgi:signal transduction histidine kinase
MSELGTTSFHLRAPWRPWRVGSSIRRFVMGWLLATLCLLEMLDWVWPAPTAALPPVVWLMVKLLLGAVVLTWVMRQAFLPVRTLGRGLNALPDTDLKAVAQRQPAELRPLATAVKRLLQAQQVAIDEQGRFLANASHQLQTPFAVLRAQLQGVMSGDMVARDTLPKMLSTIDRSSTLVRQLLSIAKVEQMVRQSNWQEVDLSAVAHDVVMEFAPLLARKNLDFSLQAVPVRLSTDAWLLGELVRNLLSNAIQHSPRDAALGLVIRVLPSGTELLVWDNGGGMDEAIQARLFEPFQSASGANGVGLGLSICRQIAASMSAEVDLYNRVQDDRIVGVDAVVRWPPAPSLTSAMGVAS